MTSFGLKLFLFQAVCHLAVILLLVTGQWYHWAIVFFVYFLTGCLGITVTFHRLLSHKSWISPKWFHVVGTLLGTYGLIGSSIGWIAAHRQHHRYTDTALDAHSPVIDGFVKTQWLSMFKDIRIQYAGSALLRSRLHAFLHRHYFKIHATIFIFWLLIDPMLLLSAYLVPAAVLWNAGSLVNTLNHTMGYRQYETADNSYNFLPTGYLVWGEGWHNNHHNRPQNARFGERLWELDIGYIIILFLQTHEGMIKS